MRSEADSTVTVYVDGTAVGSTTSNSSGAWSYTVGSALAEVLHGACGVLSIGPFGCMPSTQSDGAQSAVVAHYKDMIDLPIETSGEGEVNAHSRVQMALGTNGPIPTVEQGEAHVYTERDQAIVMRERPRSIIGTPESVAEQMHALKDRFVADELIVLTVAPSYKARLRSYELLAEAFALPSPASSTSATTSSACPA